MRPNEERVRNDYPETQVGFPERNDVSNPESNQLRKRSSTNPTVSSRNNPNGITVKGKSKNPSANR